VGWYAVCSLGLGQYELVCGVECGITVLPVS
jgi:hypothetical protein